MFWVDGWGCFFLTDLTAQQPVKFCLRRLNTNISELYEVTCIERPEYQDANHFKVSGKSKEETQHVAPTFCLSS